MMACGTLALLQECCWFAESRSACRPSASFREVGGRPQVLYKISTVNQQVQLAPSRQWLPRVVLVVEDEENLAFVVKASLQLTGFSVDDVRTGREALTLATSNGQLDLIVLDVMLPDLDGFEVCRRLRLDRIDSPILFLTALDGLHERIRGLTLGGDDYLIKPFSVEELVALLTSAVTSFG